jgi:hypothetical protein
MNSDEGESQSRVHVEIAYDGALTADGTMDAEELAPAILGIAALCKRSNDILNGGASTVQVNIYSDFKTGSFGIDFDVVQLLPAAGALVPLFTPENIKSAKEIAAIIGLLAVGDDKAFTSFLGVLKWLRGRAVAKVTKDQAGNSYTIENIEGDFIVVNGDVGTLFTSTDVRDSAHEALRPLERPGMTALNVRRAEAIVDTIPAEAVRFFEHDNFEQVDDTEVVISDGTSVRTFEVIKPSFDPRLTWHLSDGSHQFDARVDDAEFLQEAAGDMAFKARTIIKAITRVRSVRLPSGKLKTETRLLKVLEVIPPPPRGTQTSLVV